MDFLSFIYRNWVWFSVPAFLVSVSLLVFSIAGVMRTVKQAMLFGVPLLERQEIEFAAGGRVVLCIEGPLFTTRFAKLEFELDAPHGATIQGRRSLFRAKTTGFSKTRMELRYYEIPYPGRYLLRVKGLEPGESPDARHRIVFMHPHLARSIVYVISIVLASIVSIGSIVLFSMGVSAGGPVSLKVPLIVAAVVLGVVALVWFAVWSNKKEDQAIRNFSAAQGWTCVFRSDEPEGLVPRIEAKLETVSPEIDFDVHAVMTSRDWGTGLYLVRGRYRNKDSRSRSDWRYSSCLVESERFRWVRMQVDVRAGTPSLLEDPFTKFKPVDTGGSGFSRYFTVYSRDPGVALNVVNGSMQAIFLAGKGSPLFDQPDFVVSIGPGGALVRMDGAASLVEWRAMADLARRIESAMN